MPRPDSALNSRLWLTLLATLPGWPPQYLPELSLIYLAGTGLLWLAPEMRGKPLPD